MVLPSVRSSAYLAGYKANIQFLYIPLDFPCELLYLLSSESISNWNLCNVNIFVIRFAFLNCIRLVPKISLTMYNCIDLLLTSLPYWNVLNNWVEVIEAHLYQYYSVDVEKRNCLCQKCLKVNGIMLGIALSEISQYKWNRVSFTLPNDYWMQNVFPDEGSVWFLPSFAICSALLLLPDKVGHLLVNFHL